MVTTHIPTDSAPVEDTLDDASEESSPFMSWTFGRPGLYGTVYRCKPVSLTPPLRAPSGLPRFAHKIPFYLFDLGAIHG